MLPSVKSSDPTAFALATWGVGAQGSYGVLDDLDVVARGMFSAFDGELEQTRSYRNRDLVGRLRFASTHLHLEAGARYKLIAGYNIAPYVEGGAGFLWSTYRDQDLIDDKDQSYGLELVDESDGRLTVSAGVGIDWRMLNLLFVGVALRWVEVFGVRYGRAFSVPIGAALSW